MKKPMPSLREMSSSRLPSVCRALRRQRPDFESVDHLEFRIERQFSMQLPDQLLYLAEIHITSGQTQQSHVTFVRRYCPELHSICAALHALASLAYECLPGGWYGIPMEYEAEAVSITAHEPIPTRLAHWKTTPRLFRRLLHNFTPQALSMAIYAMRIS